MACTRCKSDVKNNVHYAEETQVIYPAGTNAVLWQADQKQQKIFQGNEGAEGLTCMAVNNTKRYLAVAEKCYEGAICTIFDLVTAKKRKTLSWPESDAPEFVCVAFSSDSKYLLTQTGKSPSEKHDWTLIYWIWDKARYMASIKVSNPQNSLIRECSFNPTDSSIVCVIGDGIFKFMQLKDGFKTLPVAPAKLQSFMCHTWLHDDKMLVGCENGDLLLFDNAGEFQLVLPTSPGEPRAATCVISFSKGFVIGGDDGCIRVYEKSDEPKEVYRTTKTLQVEGGAGAVRSLALSPSEELLAVTTSTSQLYQLSLLGQDLLKADETPAFDPVLTHFHTGAILGMDVCIRKPLVVTCGVDKSARVWNYVEKTCALCKWFNEEAYSIAFHPSGFHLIIGQSDKLRLMNLLMEDMKTYKDIPIKQCRECRFSNGGQYFAAVNTNATNAIQVYKTYTCEPIETLRGHNNKVRSVAWTQDDSMLVSTGADGAVYEYYVQAETIPGREGRRVGNDFVQKGTSFSSVIVHTDLATGANTMYVVGSDQMLREVFQGTTQNVVKANTTLGQIVLANSAKSLFAAVAEPDAPGPIRCYKFPLDGTLIEKAVGVAQDGTLFVFDVKRKDRNVSKRDKESALPPSDEILVTRTFLDDKQAQLVEFERQVDELSNQQEFQLRHRESYHKEEMVELDERYTAEIDQERQKYEMLREEKNDAEMEAEENIKSLQEHHAKQDQELESSFQHKMMIEVDKYQKLAAEREEIHRRWEEEHRRILAEHQKKVSDMQAEFEAKQAADRDSIKRILKEKSLAEDVHAETMRQLEQDTDREIEELKEDKETRLKAERDDKVRLRGQAGIHKRNHEELKRQMLLKEDELLKYLEEARKKDEKIQQLNKERDYNAKEIRQRDTTIGDKEGKIYELKKQNQELEKFKFVLDYKIRELKAQIDPKNDKIAEMKKEIQAMDADLEDYHKKNTQLQVNIQQLKSKHNTLQDDIVSQRKKMTDCQTVIKRFKTDLHECVQFIQEPRLLKESVSALYKKYVPNGVKKQELDSDIQREYNRQRDYLEKSVDNLKKKLLKDSDVHRQDNTRVLQENVQLIIEINNLRREIDYLKRERQQQRLHVSKLKSTTKSSTASGKSEPDLGALTREIDENKTQIDELKRKLDEQRTLRQTALADAASAET
ncbi:CFAP57 [Symbiodinium natans]|uniref:CFAP57 protein n=1 Tax=Symbiodinium natans TaxID=878477 RepID=A0A812UXD0_9DINO|nr:CFAP57 [Symbiodinium natans]